jgi:hypothetical protein
MINSFYSASFTAGSLLHKETTALLPLLLSEDAGTLVKQEIKQNNLLKINSETSRQRTVAEIVKRLSIADHSFWVFYATRTVEEQKLLLFYLCLKVYKLMFDFHFNVTVRQWNSSNPIIEPFLYQMELNEISGKQDNVYHWSDTTKGKTISVYLRILRDIDLLEPITYRLKSATVLGDFWNYFIRQREIWFLDACLLPPFTKKNIIDSAL